MKKIIFIISLLCISCVNEQDLNSGSDKNHNQNNIHLITVNKPEIDKTSINEFSTTFKIYRIVKDSLQFFAENTDKLSIFQDKGKKIIEFSQIINSKSLKTKDVVRCFYDDLNLVEIKKEQQQKTDTKKTQILFYNDSIKIKSDFTGENTQKLNFKVFSGLSVYELIIANLPLKKGYRASIPVYSFGSGSNYLDINVLSSEVVEIENHEKRDTWRVEVSVKGSKISVINFLKKHKNTSAIAKIKYFGTRGRDVIKVRN